jgi:predicted transcriptional regulator
VELHLTPEAEAKLNDLARCTHRSTDELLGQAVDYLVAYNEWFESKVRNSMAAAEGNQTVPDAEVEVWLERREAAAHPQSVLSR